MDKLVKSKLDSFDAICYIVKALALFFCFYPLFALFFSYSPRDSMNEINMRSMLISVMLLLMVLSIWMVLQPRHNQKTWRRVLEVALFMVICCASVVTSNGCNSDYKFLFIFIVVTYTLQYGTAYGITISALSAFAILCLDIFYPMVVEAPVSVQSDIALSIMFFIVAFIIGRYVALDSKHIEELTRLANVDGLTGLYNHRYFHEEMQRQWEKANKEKTGVTLLMMDLDYFKMYNDMCGHQQGDIALSLVTRTIQECTEGKYTSCRYGGEEFAIIMPGVDTNTATRFAEMIRVAVMHTKIEGEEYMPGGHLTVSLGVAENSADDTDYNAMVNRADRALYRAKYLRKNNVETYQDMFDRFTDLGEKTRDALLSVRGLVSIINLRDNYTYSHTERVAMCCDIVSKYMRLPEEDSKLLILSAYMHDIGKINISKEILISERRFTDADWEEIKKHPMGGKTILNQISGMEMVGDIVAQHHERFDGTGYPLGLQGSQIHYLASILSLADAFDAMTNNRPYQKRRSYEDALKDIRAQSGKQFNPKYVEPFAKAIEEELEKNGDNFVRYM